MNKQYVSPVLYISIISTERLLAASMKVESDPDKKVDNQEDIGFAKENCSKDYDVWEDDWSK
ncbi:MAG: hypothetical protein IJQ44_00430 [Bacteroidaceae bacterium]|nr:hypothetical protein [Bacteroidaceae bacterium]